MPTTPSARAAGNGSHAHDTWLRGPWLTAAHVGWICLVLLHAVVLLVGLSAFYSQARVPCASAQPFFDCFTLQPGGFAALGRLGISPDMVAAGELVLVLAASLVSGISGVLIAWRKWHEGMGLFVSLLLIAFATTNGGLLVSTADLVGRFVPGMTSAVRLLGIWRYPALGAFLLTFPTGRFTPRWSWLVLLLWVVPVALARNFGVSLMLPLIWITLSFGLVLGVQVYRYRHVYGAMQRQQTKWLVLAIAIAVSFPLVSAVMQALNPDLSVLVFILNGPQGTTSFLPIAVAVAVALLHYQLYDIDRLINRALIYGSLTATLALLYFAMVLGAQTILQALTGQRGQQPLFIVASTLLVAALFQPLRRRIQALVDQRFYRRRYDATKTLAAFGTALRTETDLAHLSRRLVAVVEETMQPAYVSLWLLPSAHAAEASKILADGDRKSWPEAPAAPGTDSG
jgi:hypothetical protein